MLWVCCVMLWVCDVCVCVMEAVQLVCIMHCYVCMYAGHKVERRELKGLDIVRRDWCGLAKTTGQ